jgi:hypothetical protein
MANECETNIAFFTAERSIIARQQLDNLYRAISEIKANLPPYPRHFGLGTICKHFDMKTDEWACRGEVCDITECSSTPNKKTYFELYQVDAWTPNVEMWKHILNENYPLLGMVYKAEEPGCGIFINSDMSGEYFPEKYCTDYWSDSESHGSFAKYGDEGMDYYDSERELLNDWNKRTNQEFTSVKELMEFFADQEDEEFYIHEYTGQRLGY